MTENKKVKFPCGVNTDYIKTYPCKGEPEPGECIECMKRKEDKPMTNQPNIDDVDRILQDVVDTSPLSSPRFMNLFALSEKDREERLAELSMKIKAIKAKAKQKLGEMIEGCLYYTVNSKKDFIGISASIKNLTKLGLLPERS